MEADLTPENLERVLEIRRKERALAQEVQQQTTVQGLEKTN